MKGSVRRTEVEDREKRWRDRRDGEERREEGGRETRGRISLTAS